MDIETVMASIPDMVEKQKQEEIRAKKVFDAVKILDDNMNWDYNREQWNRCKEQLYTKNNVGGDYTILIIVIIINVIAVILIIMLLLMACKKNNGRQLEEQIRRSHRYQQTGPGALSWQSVYGPYPPGHVGSISSASPRRADEHTVEIPPHNIQVNAPRYTSQNNTHNGINSGGRARSGEHGVGVGVNHGDTAASRN